MIKINIPKTTGKIIEFVSNAFEKFKSRIYSNDLVNPQPKHLISKKKLKRQGIFISKLNFQLINMAMNSYSTTNENKKFVFIILTK